MGKRQNLDYQNLGIFDMISEVSILSSEICPLFSVICIKDISNETERTAR